MGYVNRLRPGRDSGNTAIYPTRLNEDTMKPEVLQLDGCCEIEDGMVDQGLSSKNRHQQ